MQIAKQEVYLKHDSGRVIRGHQTQVCVVNADAIWNTAWPKEHAYKYDHSQRKSCRDDQRLWTDAEINTQAHVQTNRQTDGRKGLKPIRYRSFERRWGILCNKEKFHCKKHVGLKHQEHIQDLSAMVL